MPLLWANAALVRALTFEHSSIGASEHRHWMLQPLAAVCGVHIAATCGISGLHQSQSTGHQWGWLALSIQREPCHSAKVEKSLEWTFLLEEDLQWDSTRICTYLSNSSRYNPGKTFYRILSLADFLFIIGHAQFTNMFCHYRMMRLAGSKKKVKEAGLDPLSRTSPRDSPRESLIPTTCPSFMKSSLSTPPLLHFWRNSWTCPMHFLVSHGVEAKCERLNNHQIFLKSQMFIWTHTFVEGYYYDLLIFKLGLN